MTDKINVDTIIEDDLNAREIGVGISHGLKQAQESPKIAKIFDRQRVSVERKFGISFEWFVARHLEALNIELEAQNGRIGKQAVALLKSLGLVMGYYPERLANGTDSSIEANFNEIRKDLDLYLDQHKRDY